MEITSYASSRLEFSPFLNLIPHGCSFHHMSCPSVCLPAYLPPCLPASLPACLCLYCPLGTINRQGVLRVCIGIFVGFTSALTGSSGPVLLLPILISLKWDIFVALGCAQAIQIPIAVASVIAYVIGRPGVIDFVVGSILSSTLVPMLCFGTCARTERGRIRKCEREGGGGECVCVCVEARGGSTWWKNVLEAVAEEEEIH